MLFLLLYLTNFFAARQEWHYVINSVPAIFEGFFTINVENFRYNGCVFYL